MDRNLSCRASMGLTAFGDDHPDFDPVPKKTICDAFIVSDLKINGIFDFIWHNFGPFLSHTLLILDQL